MQVFFFSILTAMLFYFSSEVSGQDQSILPPSILEVSGAISKGDAEGVAHFDIVELRTLPPARLETTTAVTDGVHRFDGVLMRDLLAHVGSYGTVVTARALNDYAIEIAVEEFDQFDVLVAYELDGKPLLPSDKGPLWIVYPRDQHAELQDIRFDYRWVWQLKSLEIR
ncbi:molybdopterin-dependent oxidoreductase [Pseudochrobactrum sp. MP213Fo]|uniref:molybdopterin-dependent oxidoreductase n=1 Tax=Pseudochrobactrum sp. MP213Fo TaxID=3022250 RepID=UPI003BA0FB84